MILYIKLTFVDIEHKHTTYVSLKLTLSSCFSEHGWKVVENPKSRRAASSTPPNNLENDEVATPTTCNLPGSKPSLVTSSSFSGSKFFDGSSAPPSAGENVESVDDSGVTTTSNGTSCQFWNFCF